MTSTNAELIQIMESWHFSKQDVAAALNIPLTTVGNWLADKDSSEYQLIPMAELRLLQFSLMTENKRKHLY